jgi:hypothetical protein
MAKSSAKASATENNSAIAEFHKSPADAPTVIKKITAKELLGSPDASVMREKSFKFKITGKVSRTEEKTSKFGHTNILFKGSFLAESPIHGFVQAGQAYLPPVAEDLVYAAVKDAMAAGAVGSVEFGVECETRLDAKSSVGYVWTCRPLIKVATENNRLLQLMNGGGE